jgi:hypothetical protein
MPGLFSPSSAAAYWTVELGEVFPIEQTSRRDRRKAASDLTESMEANTSKE